MSIELESVIGSVVSAVAQARRIADEESVAIAEYYRQHPRLCDLSAPRIRLPEVTVDLPVVVDDHTTGSPGTVATPAVVNAAARNAIKESLKAHDQRLPSGVLSTFRDSFAAKVGDKPDVTEARAVYADAADTALAAVFADDSMALDAVAADRLRTSVRRAVDEATIGRAAIGPRTSVSIKSSEIAARDPGTVTTIRLSIREEGMEWTEIQNEDGSVTSRLVPE
jgi:hypothetical protein